MTGYLVELVNACGATFDKGIFEDLDSVLDWAQGRNGTTRIFIDGEEVMWNIRVSEGTIWISSRLGSFEVADIPECDIWQCLQAHDEENKTDLYDLLDDSNMVWEGY